MKFCFRCKCALDTNQENHIVIEDFNGKKSLSKVHMHKECWKEWINGKQKLNKMQDEAMKVLDFAKKMSGYEEEVELI